MLEKTIENKLKELTEKCGGLCLKFVSPGTTGVPDRIIFTPTGKVIFVELKKPTGRESGRQRFMADEMRTRGADIRVIKNLEDVKIFIDEVFGR